MFYYSCYMFYYSCLLHCVILYSYVLFCIIFLFSFCNYYYFLFLCEILKSILSIILLHTCMTIINNVQSKIKILNLDTYF